MESCRFSSSVASSYNNLKLGHNVTSEVATIHPAPPNERQGMTGRIIVLGSMESPTRFDSHTFGGGRVT